MPPTLPNSHADPSTAAQPLLVARGLTLRYGDATVLHEVDLRVGEGEFWFLLGPNGEGKTTLLRAILGELRPAAGTIELAASLRDRVGIGFVPQRCDANPVPTTVREFVGLGLVGIRADAEERRARMAWALEHPAHRVKVAEGTARKGLCIDERSRRPRPATPGGALRPCARATDRLSQTG